MTDAFSRHGAKWDAEEQRRLYDLFTNGLSIPDCMQDLQRSEAAIRHMLRQLGLISRFGEPIQPHPDFQYYQRKSKGISENQSSPLVQPASIDDTWKKKILEGVHLGTTIHELRQIDLLDARAHNALHLHDYQTIADFMDVEDWKLLRLQNFGRKSLRQIQRIKHHFAIKPDIGISSHANKAMAVVSLQQKIHPSSLQYPQRLSVETEGVREDIDFIASLVDLIGPDNRAKRILKARFGVCSEQTVLTLQDLADEFDVTRERIRQIETRMLHRVRGYIRRHYGAHLRYSELFDDEESSSLLEVQDILYEIVGSQSVAVIVKLIYCFDINMKNLAQIKGLVEGTLRAYFAKLKKQAQEDRKRKLTWRQQFISSQLLQSIVRKKTGAPDNLDAWIKDAREVNQTEFSGTIFSQKAGKEIQFESRTELKVLKTLEKMPEVDWYDVQCVQFPYKLKGKQLTYHPDIICKIVDGRIVVIEVKPLMTIAMLKNFRKAVVALQKCEKNGWYYTLLSPTEGSIENMACWEGGKEIEQELVDLVGGKLVSNYEGIDWPQMKAFMEKHDLGSRDMSAIALRNDLAFIEHPYLCGKLPIGYSWSLFIPALIGDRSSLNKSPKLAKKCASIPGKLSKADEEE